MLIDGCSPWYIRLQPVVHTVAGEPGLLVATKPLLLSGVVAVQLGAVRLLDAVQRAVPRGAAALCAEDLHAFCLEVCSGNRMHDNQATHGERMRGDRGDAACAAPETASHGEAEGAGQAEQPQRARLGVAVRRLLTPLMAVPQPGAPAVATRQADALQPSDVEAAAP